MPAQWTISHADRLVVAIARQPATVADIEHHFVGVAAAAAARRPLAIFRELHLARQRLDAQALPDA